MDAIFFTGFPGFLGSELVPRVLARAPEAEAVCLVQPKYLDLARQRRDELIDEHPSLEHRLRIVKGDIVEPDLGLGRATDLRKRVTEIFHLAAIYDLSVGRETATRVNVDGTRHMLSFARHCKALRRFQYVSTCFVSGRYHGAFTEAMLDEGQSFNNIYEETKYLAEVDVQRAMQDGLPTTIYRPAIVVGDSNTGATQKYDGPYFVIRWLLRQPRIALMPVVGDTRHTMFNMVPRDFVVDAIAYLSGRKPSGGRVFQLADPHPLTVDEVLTELGRATHRTMLRVPLSLQVAKLSIDRVPFVYSLMRIPSATIDYFVQPTLYASGKTQRALAGSGIKCPSFREYSDRLVDFVRAHPEIGSAAMV